MLGRRSVGAFRPAQQARQVCLILAALPTAFAVAALQAQPPISSQRPLDTSVIALQAADVPADVPLKHR
jgi:hypothetical protein